MSKKNFNGDNKNSLKLALLGDGGEEESKVETELSLRFMGTGKCPPLFHAEPEEKLAESFVDGIPRCEDNKKNNVGETFLVEHVPSPEDDPLETWSHHCRNNNSTSFGGYVIPNGQIGFVITNGEISLLAPGRRRIYDFRSEFIGMFSLNSNLIEIPTMTIARVTSGEVGLALHMGEPAILDPGRHILRQPEWQFIGVQDASLDIITWEEFPQLNLVRVRPGEIAFVTHRTHPMALHPREAFYELVSPRDEFGEKVDFMQDVNKMDDRCTLDVVRVKQGMVGLAWDADKPVLVGPSELPYEFRAPQLRFVTLADQMSDEIRMDDANSQDLVRVRPGHIGLFWECGMPKLLLPRPEPYRLMKPRHQFHSLVSVTTEHIHLGSLHIITITTGRRGVVWVDGTASVVHAGRMVFYEENFKYGGSHEISEKLYDLGPFKYVTVDTGERGVKHTKGELDILDPGTHCLRCDEGETFEHFVSVQQQVMKVENLLVRTRDNVELRVDAVMTYNISDPIKAIRGVRDLPNVLRQRTETTLTNIFSNLDYGQKAPPVSSSGDKTVGSASGSFPMVAMDDMEHNTDAAVAEDGVSADLVHEQFMKAIQATASETWGVTVGDLSVANIHIVNQDLYHDLEQRAVTTVKIDTARANAENESQVGLIQAASRAKETTLKAQGETNKKLVEARAAAEVKRAHATAEAEAERIVAEGKAEALRIMSRAEAEAEVTRAEARKRATELEGEGTELLGANAMRLRMWLAQNEMARDMFRNQRTFIDTQNLPSLAEMLNLNMMMGMGSMFNGGNLAADGNGTTGGVSDPAPGGSAGLLAHVDHGSSKTEVRGGPAPPPQPSATNKTGKR